MEIQSKIKPSSLKSIAADMITAALDLPPTVDNKKLLNSIEEGELTLDVLNAIAVALKVSRTMGNEKLAEDLYGFILNPRRGIRPVMPDSFGVAISTVFRCFQKVMESSKFDLSEEVAIVDWDMSRASYWWNSDEDEPTVAPAMHTVLRTRGWKTTTDTVSKLMKDERWSAPFPRAWGVDMIAHRLIGAKLRIYLNFGDNTVRPQKRALAWLSEEGDYGKKLNEGSFEASISDISPAYTSIALDNPSAGQETYTWPRIWPVVQQTKLTKEFLLDTDGIVLVWIPPTNEYTKFQHVRRPYWESKKTSWFVNHFMVPAALPNTSRLEFKLETYWEGIPSTNVGAKERHEGYSAEDMYKPFLSSVSHEKINIVQSRIHHELNTGVSQIVEPLDEKT